MESSVNSSDDNSNTGAPNMELGSGPRNVGLSDVVVSKYEVFHTYLNYVFMTCGYQRQCPKLMTSYLHLSFITSLQMSQPDVNM